MSEFMKWLRSAPVEWKPLGEIANIGTGRSNRQDEDTCGQYPFYVRSKTVLKSNTYQFDETAIIIPGEGGVGDIFHYVEGKYALHQRAYRVNVTHEKLLPKFLYFYMSNSFKSYITTKSVGATATSIRKPMIEDFEIPIPPMEVQEEIVRILDKFTELIAALNKELELRRKQYDYYLHHLLTFDPSEVTYKPLEEVFEMRNGYTPSKSNQEFWTDGTIPWFRMEDLRTNGRVLSDSIQHITPKAIKGKGLFKAGSIIMATTATIGEHALLIADSLANQRFTNFSVRKSLTELLLPKFVYYYFYIIDEWCKRNVNTSSFPSVDMKLLKQVSFPIPPLSEQERIVGILDKFERLTHSLTEGLPREIELRQKQYEYYRNLLLSFE